MNIAFRIDISETIGTGHYVRMRALADVFSEMGHRCAFFEGKDEPINFSGYDVVILDTYEVSNEYIASLNAHGRLVVCFDDNSLYTYNCDVVVNSNLYANELNLMYGNKAPKFLLGGSYTILRNEFRKSKPITIRDRAKNVFICFGGTDLRNMTPLVIRAIKDIPKVCLHVILGSHTRNDEEVLAFSDSGNIKIYKTPSSILSIMRRCDIAISAAGTMVYEYACIGMPSILITQADNQARIADYMKRNNLMYYGGDWKDINLHNLRFKVVSLLEDFRLREMMSQKLVESLDKQGVNNIAEIVMKTLGVFEQRRRDDVCDGEPFTV